MMVEGMMMDDLQDATTETPHQEEEDKPFLDGNVQLFLQTQERNNCISLNELAWENNCTTSFLRHLEKDVTLRIEKLRSQCSVALSKDAGMYDNDRILLQDFPWLAAAAHSKYVAEIAEFEQELGKVVQEWARNYAAKKKLQQCDPSYEIHESLERDDKGKAPTTIGAKLTKQKQKSVVKKKRKRKRKKKHSKLLKEIEKFGLVKVLSESESELEDDEDSEPELEPRNEYGTNDELEETTNSEKNQFRERASDFQPSQLQPGEWGRPILKNIDPRTVGRQDDTVFDDKVFLLQMPEGFVDSMLEYVKNEGLTDGLLGKHLGIHQEKQAVNQHNPLGDTGWTIHRFDRTSDILNLFPSTGEKLREFLEQFDRAGLGQMLQKAGEELGFDKNNDGSYSFTLTEAAFIGVSYKDKAGKYHLDIEPAASGMLTLLVPLILPPAENPELIFEGTDGAKREYRYEEDVAVAFRSGVWHNTNRQLIQREDWRFMATLHFGVYPKDLRQVKHMADALEKSFKMPPARMASLPRGWRVRQGPNNTLIPGGVVNWRNHMELSIHTSEDGTAVLRLPPDSHYCPLPKGNPTTAPVDTAMAADAATQSNPTTDNTSPVAPLVGNPETTVREATTEDATAQLNQPPGNSSPVAPPVGHKGLAVPEVIAEDTDAAMDTDATTQLNQRTPPTDDTSPVSLPVGNPGTTVHEVATEDTDTDAAMDFDTSPGNSPVEAPEATDEDTAMKVDETPNNSSSVAPSPPPSETKPTAEDKDAVMQLEEEMTRQKEDLETTTDGVTATVAAADAVIKLDDPPDNLLEVASLIPPSETDQMEEEATEEDSMKDNIVLLPAGAQTWLPSDMEKGLEKPVSSDDQSMSWDSQSGTSP